MNILKKLFGITEPKQESKMKLSMLVPKWYIGVAKNTWTINDAPDQFYDRQISPYEYSSHGYYRLGDLDPANMQVKAVNRGEYSGVTIPHTVHDKWINGNGSDGDFLPQGIIDFINEHPSDAKLFDVYKFVLPADAFVSIMYVQRDWWWCKGNNVITQDWKHDKGRARMMHLNTQINHEFNVARDFNRDYVYDSSMMHRKGELWIVDQTGNFSEDMYADNAQPLTDLNHVQLAIFTNE